MKVKPHNTRKGVFVGETTGVVLATLNPEGKPQELTNQDNEITRYHWAKVAIKDNNGLIKNGSAIVWDKLLQQSPTEFTEGQSIDLDIQLNGKGAGCAQVRLSNGRFEVADFLSAEQLEKYSLTPSEMEAAPKEEA